MSASLSDLDLMLRVKAGEAQCMGSLLETYRARMIHFLHRIVQNQAVAEELAQEVFLRVYCARSSYEPTATFTAWLYRIATNLALNWRRGRRVEGFQESLDAVPPNQRRRELQDRKPTIDRIILREAESAEVRRAVAALPPRQRAVVIMHKYDDLQYWEIAQALNCSLPTVKSLLFRAYSTLRIRLVHMSGGKRSRNDIAC